MDRIENDVLMAAARTMAALAGSLGGIETIEMIEMDGIVEIKLETKMVIAMTAVIGAKNVIGEKVVTGQDCWFVDEPSLLPQEQCPLHAVTLCCWNVDVRERGRGDRREREKDRRCSTLQQVDGSELMKQLRGRSRDRR